MNAPYSSASNGTQHRTDITIVGNGAVGKATALALAQQGWQVTLLATTASPVPASWDVRVYALNHVAHRLLHDLKVWPAMDASRIAPVERMEVFGDAQSRLDFDAYAAHADALTWIVEDSNLNHALDTALRFSHQVKVIPARAVGMSVDMQAATLVLDNGESIVSRLVIGADGKQSWVRHQCDIGYDYRPYGQRAIVTNFASALPHHGTAYQWFSVEEGIIALLPLPGQHVSLVWSAPDALAAELIKLPLPELAQRLAPHAMPVLGALTPVEPHLAKSFPLELVKPHSMIAQRVALVGDAAHAVHPLAGHGMNLGFGDVAALQHVLQDKSALDGDDIQPVLRRYARMRKEEVLLMQVTTDSLARLFGTPATPLRQLRNLGLNLVNKLPVLKTSLIRHALGKASD